jgi:hypothetical protein
MDAAGYTETIQLITPDDLTCLFSALRFINNKFVSTYRGLHVLRTIEVVTWVTVTMTVFWYVCDPRIVWWMVPKSLERLMPEFLG